MPALLEVENLTVRFQVGNRLNRRVVRAVEDVSFSIGESETVAIVGESGSGKSTVARAILRLVKPLSGSIVFDGSDLSKLSKREMREKRRDIQAVFQDPYSSLDPMMTVEDIIAEPLVNYGVAKGSELSKRVGELLELVRLPRWAGNKYAHEFSGGQRQRIAIARSLALNPRLIICDEAVSALDVSIRNQVLTLLQELQRDLGVSYMFIGHDLSVVQKFADRVAVMYLGHIVEYGATEDVFSAPRHPYTEALLSATPSHNFDERRKRVILVGEIPDPANPPSGCVFRTRCGSATSECATDFPPRVETPHGAAFCHHPLHTSGAR